MKTLDELLLELGRLNIKIWADGNNLRYQAPKGILTSDILAQIKTHKTEILAFLNQSVLESQSTIKPVDATIKNDLPLSLTQQQFWLLHHLEESNYIYNMVRAFRLEGDLDIPSFERAIQCLIERHSILRTGFKVVDGSPGQVITPHLNFEIPVIDLQNLSETERISQAQQLLLQERTRAFDLNQSPVWRVTLIRLLPHIHLLMFNLHHIICDDWSIQVFLRELSALYQEVSTGKIASLPELPIQYADFAHWQNQQIALEKFHQQLNYWQQKLADVVPILELPYLSGERNHNTKQAFQSGIVPLSVSTEVTYKLKQLSQQSGTTFFTTLLTAFAILLSRYTHQEDLIVGTVIANRTSVQTNPLIGAFVNTLGLRIQIPDNPTFRELLTEVQKVVLEAYAHSEVPFVKVIEALKIDRKSGNNSLLQVMFTLETITQEELQLAGVMTTVLELNKPTAGATFDLTLNLWETNSQLQGKLEYNAYLFNEEIIQRSSGHFQTLLARIVESPDQCIGNLSILSVTEREQLLGKEIQEIESEFLCLHELFEAQVEKTPEAVALKFAGQQLTYRELNQQANKIAYHLQTLGVKPETLVGICVERSLEMIVGILGILKAGGAYIPLDPSNPQERLNHILEDAQVQVLVTNSQLRNTLDQSNFVVCLDEEADKIAQYPGNNLVSGVQSDNLAYMIYTSGSTGKPKGVLITHQNVVRLFKATESCYQFNETDVWTLFHSFAFDFSVWELWGGLLYGGCVVVVPYEVSRDSQAFYNLLIAEQVTVLNQTPSAFYQLIQVDEHSKTTEKLSLRVVIFGGEALSLPLLQPWFERHGDQLPQLVNMYGITETTVHVTIRRLTLADVKATSSLIGQPISDLQIYLLDKYQQPVPIGVVGELYVGGGGVARGYWRRSELTQERFVPNPFSNQQQGRLYKTGDLARYLPTGELEYKGRIDHQVKIRGFRIELGEIKALLSGHQGVQECVVLAREDEPNNKRLVAYIVPDHIQASTILNLVSLKEQGILSDRSLYELPNGMMIAHLNKTETEFLYQEIFTEQSYLQHGITLDEGDCIFDVGANIGLFSLFAAQACPKVKIYAFEPIPPVFELLRLNAELYNLDAKVFNIGLSG
ncbi:amino acid adenylation domain-containing protein [Nostoc sp. LPT]|uniref:amino acid adenylation domain-containing protein n=1 Tax=Nostoc sp. LPT TaxID=2815387 RepID=UPI001D51FDD6|nr:amino acid adenylation domain-containing protein [Nostoc sp. LPT]MBN4002012.1 amino acid adenylation domain-containing protein [Nostoc sp. LPT]